MFDGLFLLGAVSSSRHVKERAARAGQRAIASGQRIAKSAPRLARAIMSAGQKALSLGRKGAKTTSLPGASAKAAASSSTKESSAPRARLPFSAPQERARLSTIARRTRDAALAPSRSTAKHAPKRRGTRLGEEATDITDEELTAEEQRQADVYSDLADAATELADFLSQVQDLLAVLPKTIPLYPDGEAKVEQMQIWFTDPLERALSGDQQALSRARGIVDAVKTIMDEASNPGPSSIWAWIRNANAYARSKGLGIQSPNTPGQPTTSGTVSSISVSPASVALQVGAQQAFSASCVDYSGKSVTPKRAIAWSVSQGLNAQTLRAVPQGATIDPSGIFTASAPGTYTIKAEADGVSGTARVSVQAGGATAADVQSTYPGAGGGDSQSPASYGGDYGSNSDEDYYDEGGSDEGRGGLYDYAVSEEEEADLPTDGSVLDEAASDDGGEGDDPAESEMLGGLTLLGRRGGGSRGGQGMGRHRPGGGRDGGYAIYPWPIYSEGIEIEDEWEPPIDLDELAAKIAEHLKNGTAQEASDGLQMLGAEPVSAQGQQSRARFEELKAMPVGSLKRQAQLCVEALRKWQTWLLLDDQAWAYKDALEQAEFQKKNGDEAKTDAERQLCYARCIHMGEDALRRFTKIGPGDSYWDTYLATLQSMVRATTGAIAQAPGAALEWATGVPSWAWYAGGAAALATVGYGAWKLALAAAPGVSGAVTRRYLG